MNPADAALLTTAERRGRAIAGSARAGAWHLEFTDNPAGYAMAAAARWLARMGGDVAVHLALPDHPTQIAELLATSLLAQGLVDTGYRGCIRSDLLTVVNKHTGEKALWDVPLSAAAPFVVPVTAGMAAATCAEAREVDRVAGDRFAVPGICLMENAAAAAVIVAQDMLAGIGGPVVVAAGGGNNGGDGLALARGLDCLGVPVEIALFKNDATLSGDAAVNLLLLEGTGVRVHRLHARPERFDMLLPGRCLIVDALAGTGFWGALRPPLDGVVRRINASGIPVLALDIPSGLDGDSGRTEGVAVRADRTVTFAAVKQGLFREKGPALAGRLYLGDIGAPTAAFPSRLR